MEIATEKPNDYTIVVFGSNANNVLALVSLLSDDGHLVVERQNDQVIITNPTNAAWTPDAKYHVCHEVQPARIPDCLENLKKPFRFVVAFDATDMFIDPFWYMLFHLAEFVSQDKVYSNQLRIVAINIPHDEIPLKQHSDELKNSIDNALKDRYVVQIQLAGMHVIEKRGPVNEMSELRGELVVIKNFVDE